jgi:disulfide bond formation protein DsbB
MYASAQTLLRTSPAALAAGAIALGGVATILGAWFFQYVLGLPPCPLCIEQRIPYYLAIPVAALVALAAARGAPRGLVGTGLIVLALIMLVSAAFGGYHAGIEWKFWVGPQDCSGPLMPLGNAGDLLRQLGETRPVRCDEAAWRFLGISLAGWNAVISLGLAGIAVWGARAVLRRPAYGSSSVSQ